MNAHDIARLVDGVRAGKLSRRGFMDKMVGLGLSVPTASMLLLSSGVAQAQSPMAYKPTKRGGGGPLKLLMWQGPTLLNPHFATGNKDDEGSRIFYEPLVRWDADANLVPVLAAELPSRENGGLAADGKSVLWRLKKNVTWHDGMPFTADDVIFNWQYATDPATAAVTSGSYTHLKMEKVDSHTVRVLLDKPSPFWTNGYPILSMIPKHLFAAYTGAKSRDAPANLKPVGTGPYKFVDFKPGDMVRGELYANYHQPNRPYFDSIELKGGGDAASAARAVLQSGECDYAWNLLVEDEILKKMEVGGKGRVVFAPGGTVEALYLNYTDPGTEVGGERSSAKTRHPLFSDPVLVQAMGLLVDRQAVQEFIYGRAGTATPNFVDNPQRYRSPNLKADFNLAKANTLLDGAGYKRGPDGVREKNGRKLRFVFQTSINAPRQKVQSIIKQACQKAGIELELKSIVPSMYFSSDVANTDTYGKFYADMQMYAVSLFQPDPERHMQRFVSWEIAAKSNKWLGVNLCRWHSDEFDQAFRDSESELDPVKRAALYIRMNDLACRDGFVIPLSARKAVTGLGNRMVAPLTGWGLDMSSLPEWFRDV